MREYEILKHCNLSQIQMWLNQRRHNSSHLIIETNFYLIKNEDPKPDEHAILISYIINK